jgi:hypothetical protein
MSGIPYGPLSKVGIYVEHYGCVKCQKRHFDDEEIFQEHLWAQSKHGVDRMTIEQYMDIRATLDDENYEC